MEHPVCSSVTELSWLLSLLCSLHKEDTSNMQATCEKSGHDLQLYFALLLWKKHFYAMTFHKQFICCSSYSLPLCYLFEHIHRSPPLVPILSQQNPFHVIYIYLTSVLILSSYTCLGLPHDILPSNIPTQISYAHLLCCRIAKVSHLSCPSAWQLWPSFQQMQAFYAIRAAGLRGTMKVAAFTSPIQPNHFRSNPEYADFQFPLYFS
jgi:hypothetical protein